MPRLRKCGSCGACDLRPVARNFSVFNSVILYRCDACATRVYIIPTASIGVITCVGFLALSFWGFILFRSGTSPSAVTVVLFGLAILALGFVILGPLLKHFQNPPVAVAIPVSLNDPAPPIFKRLIIWLEGFGFIAGLIAPVVVIVGVLAIAALIGFVNFTYFGT